MKIVIAILLGILLVSCGTLNEGSGVPTAEIRLNPSEPWDAPVVTDTETGAPVDTDVIIHL